MATNRANFPDTAEIVDSLTAAFGPVRVLHAVENGKEIGKPQPFDGIDINLLIPLLERTEAREEATSKKGRTP